MELRAAHADRSVPVTWRRHRTQAPLRLSPWTCVDPVDQERAPSRGFLAAVKASAVRRLGKPLLVAYFVLLVVGVVVVGGSVVWMAFPR